MLIDTKYSSICRQVHLHRGSKGFFFELRHSDFLVPFVFYFVSFYFFHLKYGDELNHMMSQYCPFAQQQKKMHCMQYILHKFKY